MRITVVAYPDQGAGNDPEALRLAFHHQGPTFIIVYCQAGTNLVNRDLGFIKHTFVTPGFLLVKLTSLQAVGNIG